MKLIRPSRAHRLSVTIVIALLGCGGGSSGGVNGRITSLADRWTGVVRLKSNGCADDLSFVSQTISFQHEVTESFNNTATVTVSLTDNGVGCRDLEANPASGEFAAVCDEAAFAGAPSELRCKEDRVWEYTLAEENEDAVSVVRTSDVHCSQAGVEQFSCSLVYAGLGSRVIPVTD